MKPYSDNDDLIHRDIDGRLSDEERARLSALLEQDPAAREEHRRLANLRDLLAGLPKEDPPAHLTAKVLREIRVRRGAGSAWGFWPGRRLALGYTYAAAAGAALALLSVQVLTGGHAFGPGPAERNAAATIGSPGTAGTHPWLAYRSLGARHLAVDVAPPGKGAFDVTVSYDAAAFDLLGVSNETGGIDQLDAIGGKVRWSQERPQRVTVHLAPRAASGAKVDVHYLGEGGASGSGSVELPGIN